MSTFTKAEAEVARRLDDGQPRERILRETGIHPTVVDRVRNWSCLDNDRAAAAAVREGSRLLFKALQREGFA